jgi:hypothetical protein
MAPQEGTVRIRADHQHNKISSLNFIALLRIAPNQGESHQALETTPDWMQSALESLKLPDEKR